MVRSAAVGRAGRSGQQPSRLILTILAFPVAAVIGFGGQAVVRHALTNDATTAAPASPKGGIHDERLHRDDEGNTEAIDRSPGAVRAT